MNYFMLRFADLNDAEKHKNNVKVIENIENLLIQKMIDAFGIEKILNKKIHSPKIDKETENKMGWIVKVLGI